MIKIFHNPRCSKSRAGLAYLESKNIAFEVIDYLKNPLSIQDLKSIISKTGKTPFELVRTHEQIFKDQFKGKSLSDDQWLEVLTEFPKLLHRPIVVSGDRAVFAQPPEEIDHII